MNRTDGGTQLDVRRTLETGDGALIYMTYKGLRHGPADVMARLAAGEVVDPGLLYFRTTPFFETAADGTYAWMNTSCFVSTGRREPTGQIGRASCRERVCQYVSITVGAATLKKNTTYEWN